MKIGDKVIYVCNEGSFCGKLSVIMGTYAKVILADRYANAYIEVPLNRLQLADSKNEV
jgi:hypothetical protein